MSMAGRFRERARVAWRHGRLAWALVPGVLPAAAQDIERVRAMVLAGSVVKVEAIGADGRLALGTAVAVGRGTFVSGGAEIRVDRSKGDQEGRGAVVAVGQNRKPRDAMDDGRLPFAVAYGRKLVARADLDAYAARARPDGVKRVGRPPKRQD